MRSSRRALPLLLALILGLGACKKSSEAAKSAVDSKTGGQEAKPAEKEPPAKVPRLTVAFAPQDAHEVSVEDAKKVTAFLQEQTGYEFDVFIPKSYAAAIRGLKKGDVHLAYLDAWSYLKGHLTADAMLLVGEEKGGQAHSWSHWYVRSDGKIASLQDLKKKKVAFTVPTSAAGFLFPYARLVEEGVVEQGADPNEVFEEVVFVGSEAAAIKALADGKLDAVAASDSAVTEHLEEEARSKVKVLSKQGPVPHHVLAVRADVPQEQKEKLEAALLALGEKEELLRPAFGVEKLVKREHYETVKDLEKAQELATTEYPVEDEPKPKK